MWYAGFPLVHFPCFENALACCCMCVCTVWMCVCLCVHACAHVRVSPESQNSIIVNISFDGESGSGCWPAALLSFGTELPTSGLCQHSLTVFVCVRVCVYWGPCLSPRAVSHWMGNRFAQINQRCSINKRSPIPSCLQAAILRAWESSLASSRTSCSHRQASHRHAGSRVQPGMSFQQK